MTRGYLSHAPKQAAPLSLFSYAADMLGFSPHEKASLLFRAGSGGNLHFPHRPAFEAMADSSDSDDSAFTNISIFTRALQFIRQDYVDEKKISYHALTYAAMKGMLNSLDPHSQFMDVDDFKGMQDDTKSQFGGLGVIVSQKDGNLVIVSPMEDTPGFKAGLMPDDQILKINGAPTEKMELNDAIAPSCAVSPAKK